jgi:tripartite-type tricarboxylate transporter receptor subunit TctC
MKSWTSLLAAAMSSLVVAATAPAQAQAQDYPNKPIRLGVGFAAGGGTDVTARVFAQRLGDVLKQPVVVENRPGAAGAIAASEIMRSGPDGYRLLMLASGTFIQSVLSATPPYKIDRDFTPISMATSSPLVVVAGPSVQAKDIKELIEFARANPDKLTFGSDGFGGTSHLAGEMFNAWANVKIRHVPFKGSGEATVAVASGQVDIGFPSLAGAQSLLQAGKYRALGVTTAKRSALAPNLPTMDELGLKGFDIAAWYAFIGPAGMPRAVVDKLNAAIASAASTPEMKESMTKQVLEVTLTTPEQMATYFRQQNAVISKLGKDASIKLD